MLCFGGKSQSPEEKAAASKSHQIEKNLREDTKVTKQKLLLLGTGDAGKSTFCKQMQVIHSGGFKKEEITRFAEILRDNCLVSMQTILLAAKEWDIPIEKKNESMVDAILNAQTDLNDELSDHIIALWKTKEVKDVMKRSNELQIPGGGAGAKYFFENCKRFSSPDFQPTPEDIIRAKMRTTGISEVQFKVQGTEFTMVDVGGQRSERRKWLHCFGDVTAVIFLVAMNEYDMVLEEDNKTNRMEESLKLFQKLTGSQWFDEVSFILFLNKSDLFAERIKTSPLQETFVDYEDFVKSHPELKDFADEDRGYEYIKSQYVNNFAGVRLYPFKTCAIDTENCSRVFTAVKDTVISSVLNHVGI